MTKSLKRLRIPNMPKSLFLNLIMLLSMLTFAMPSLAVDKGRQDFGVKGEQTTIDQTGKCWYEFRMLYFNYHADNCHFKNGASNYITIDGVNVMSIASLCRSGSNYYVIGGDDNEENAGRYRDHDGYTAGYTINDMVINGVHYGKVRFSLWDPGNDANKEYWITVGVCFEENNIDKDWKIGVSGIWINQGNEQTVNWSTTFKPTATKLSGLGSNYGSYTRKNGKIVYTSPNLDATSNTTDNCGNTVTWSYQLMACSSSTSTGKYSGGTYGSWSVTGGQNTKEMSVSNYSALEIYPRIELNSSDYAYWSNDNKIPFRFSRNFSKVKIGGFPRPKKVDVDSYDAYTKTVNLKWDSEVQDDNNYDSNGKWRVFRQNGSDASTLKYLGETTGFGAKTFQDQTTDKEYYDEKKQNTYTYIVVFCPNGWNVEKPSDASDLSAKVEGVSIKRTFAFDSFTSKPSKQDITLKWTFTPIKNASTENPQIFLERSIDKKEWIGISAATQTVSNNNTSSGSYIDNNGLLSDYTYYYRLKIHTQETDVYSKILETSLADNTELTDFTASRGTYSSGVKLKWTVSQAGSGTTQFNLYRRPLTSNSEEDWEELTSVTGTANEYSYDDDKATAGSFYSYKVLMSIKTNTGTKSKSMTTDGFCLSSGIISGRIYYDSGTAVAGAKVLLKPSNTEGKSLNAFSSLALSGTGSGIAYTGTNKVINQLFGSDFAIQMYLNPDAGIMNDGQKSYTLFDTKGTYRLSLKKADDKKYQFIITAGEKDYDSGFEIPADEWTHVTASYEKASHKVTFTSIDKKDSITVKTTTLASAVSIPSDTIKSLALGNTAKYDATNSYTGLVDEFRFFTKALSEKDIKSNYSHTLSGSEDKLAIYWPMDEGITAQNIAYDFSKSDSRPNGRHGIMKVAASSSNINIPSSDQLSLCAVTDSIGGYMINGIPFSGEGTNYVITPTLGVHKFNPSSTNRFINMNSLVHSGVDFKDESSFPVSGSVLYKNTTIPVEGATLYVDGSIATRNKEMVTTNEQGEFTIDVPIGDHKIEVKLNGHVFEDNGREPADPDSIGLLNTYEGAVSGLTFWDTTTVTVAGRVAGGDIENAKPLGLNQGTANIGQATIVLDFENSNKNFINAAEDNTQKNSTVVSYIKNTKKRDFEATQGKAYVKGGKNAITIETDSTTGEFVAQLPPLQYTVTSVTIPSQPDIKFTSLPIIDATTTLVQKTDSVLVAGKEGTETAKYQYFKYNASAKLNYKSKTILDVTENADGSFGDETIDVSDLSGNTNKVTLYTIDKETGDINYTFGAPVYQELDRRKYRIHGYELYENRDKANEIKSSTVPLIGMDITVKNQFSTAAAVYVTGEICESESDEISFSLDSLGCADYSFQVGFPNIQPPYTRGIAISYTMNGETLSWEGNKDFKAIVIGSLNKGNDFVTDGPDEVLMILRDPPGSNSFAVWSKGSSVTTEKARTVTVGSETSIMTESHLGAKTNIGTGGLMLMKFDEIENKANLNVGTNITGSFANNKSHSTTITTTKDISTSDTPDFVGAVGDVFVGTAKNRIFGACTQVKIAKNEATSKYELIHQDALTIGEEFTTSFTYTQNYIENILLDKIDSMRNAILIPVQDIKAVATPAAGEDPIYVTTLTRDSEDYGAPNDKKDLDITKEGGKAYMEGSSYTIILPADYEERIIQDKVQYYNNQKDRWIKALSDNEKAKVQAIQNSATYLYNNYSFDAGSKVAVQVDTVTNETRTNTEVEEVKLIVGTQVGLSLNDTGVLLDINETVTENSEYTQTRVEETTESTRFELVEDGDDDYLSVDVFTAPDHFGPIFYTRAGATCAPYEDEIVTKYYQPGTVISHKTLQIEKPELEVVDQIVTGVPAGKEAVFRIKIHNNSETGEDCYYGLWVNPESNPDGAQVYLEGQSIAGGIEILVPYGQEMIKTLKLVQTDPTILNYENISLSLYSTSQPDDTGIFPGIYSDAKVSVYFQPTCSDIALSSSTSLVNTSTESPVELSIYGYDYSMQTLQGVRLQYKGLNDANWTTLQEYVKDKKKVAADPNLKELTALTGTDKLIYSIDLRESKWSDQTYVFRAITVCNQNGGEINNESAEIEVARDMTVPQLIATPTPSSGILNSGDDISITFNEDIRQNDLSKLGNFTIYGVMNETEVVHETALNLSGDSPAKTEATLDLTNKSFAASFWMNYTTDGKILMHGTTGNSFTASIADGKLVIDVAGKKQISTETLPVGKWLYVNINYDNTGTTPVINAGYAMDATSVDLIKNAEVGTYSGNGPIAIGGNGLTAKMQELSLWDSARSLIEAQGTMYKTKSQYTNGLIGYWQLNEGHGTVATDRSRSRDLTLASENPWWSSATNYSLALDGKTAVSLDASKLATTTEESYLLEGWFRAEKTQPGVASLMSVGDKLLNLRLNAKGNLELVVNGKTNEVSTTDLRDDQWHHIAFNALKSTNGSAIVYVDGKPVRQFAASTIPAFQGDALILGAHRTAAQTYDSYLKGNIDDVRVWKSRRTADIINEQMYTRLDASKEVGLAAYFPLEKASLSSSNLVVTTTTAEDMTGNVKDLVILQSGTAKTDEGGFATTYTAVEGTYTSAVAPSLKVAPNATNVQFDFVASERQILVNLQEEPYKLEGCTIYVSARNVNDIHYNSCEPITWSVYVQKNNLKWSATDLNITKGMDEEKTVSVDLSNISASTEAYAVTGIPSWLSITKESGSLNPLGKNTLSITANSGVAVGTYETTLYVTGSQNIATPLNITLTVEGETPGWVAIEDENTMNVVGQISINGINSSDTRDMVAAFNGTKCVGVARPKYYPRYDAFYVLMDIYGSKTANLTYKVYDASEGKVYPSVSMSKSAANKFNADTFVGTFADPVVITTNDLAEQEIALNAKGWKWFSLYVTPNTNTPAGVFSNTASSITGIVNNAASASYSNGSWTGNLKSFSNNTMYKLNAKAALSQTVVGKPVAPANVEITLNKAWTWIGYPSETANSLGAAFADADPQEGDLVKSQKSFAIYTGGEWVGSLSGLTPGEGYCYYSNASAAKKFHFQTPSLVGRKAKKQDDVSNADVVLCKENMTMVAVVMDGDEIVEDAEISVYAGAELRGRSAQSVANKHFIAVGGNSSADAYQIVVSTARGDVQIPSGLSFSNNAQLGTFDNPYIIQLDDATGIAGIATDIRNITIYDTNGAIVSSVDNPSGISADGINNDVPGVYVQKITYVDGRTYVTKIIK